MNYMKPFSFLTSLLCCKKFSKQILLKCDVEALLVSFPLTCLGGILWAKIEMLGVGSILGW
jgi:hypothetical protein